MNFLTLENISKQYGEKTLFDNINLQINQGQKVALVAKNGSGKTTLLRVIAGVEPSDGATSRIIIKKGASVGWLPQDPNFSDEQTIIDAIFESDNPQIQAIKAYEKAMLIGKSDDMERSMLLMDDEKAWDFEARIKEVLFKLNISDLTRKIGMLSGGQVKRVALAKLIIEAPRISYP